MHDHESNPEGFIYHIADPEDWKEQADMGSYASPSLETEGFIHCSTPRQVERSLNKFFAGRTSVLLLKIDPAMLTSRLKYEPADNDSFPHIYGELNTDAVIYVEYLEPDEDGRFSFDREGRA